MLTLVQTGKSKPRPIVMMEPEGSSYWTEWKRFVRNQLERNGFIDKEDLSLFRIARTADEAVGYIEGFYRVYHSIRYVSGLTVLRLNRKLPDSALDRLNRDFRDILTEGQIKFSPPTDKEVRRNEYLDLPRITMNFNMRNYGRLYEMIEAINKS